MTKTREREKFGDVTVRGMAEVGLEGEEMDGDLRRNQREQHLRRRRRGARKEEEKRRRKSSNGGGISSNENSCAGSNASSLLTAESCGGGSVLSTTSASADRCFVEPNRDSQFPHFTHLAGRSRCSGSGQDPDLDWRTTSVDKHGSKDTDQEITYSREEDHDDEVGDEEIEATILDPAKHSFSLALKECQNRRFRSEWVPSTLVSLGNQRKRRPASLDLNSHMSDTSISSPRSLVFSGVSKKNSTAFVRNQSSMFLSPGTPNYRQGGGLASGYQKGWSSERVPLPVNAGRRFGSSAALLPLGNGGKALPSKWEDAEKWICSPVSGDGDGLGIKSGHSALPPHHRRPKSKSGPLGAPGRIGVSYSSSASPALSGYEGSGIPDFLMNSPFVMGGIIMEDLGCHGKTNDDRGENGDVCGREGGRSHSAQSEHGMVRSASVHGWSDMLMESSSSLPSSQDGKHDSSKDGGTTASSVIIRKDMATQMSPESSNHSSSKGWSQPSSPPHSSHTIGELHNHFSKLEVRDVQVDRELLMSMSRLSGNAKEDVAVRHALAVRAAVTSNNYVVFFRLYKKAPNLNTHLMDLYVEKMRFEAIRCICKSYRPGIPISYICRVLGFSKMDLPEDCMEYKDTNGLEECDDWLRAHGAVLTSDNKGEVQLDTKASSSTLYMPEPEDAVSHGDATLAVGDFMTRTCGYT